MAFKSSNPSSRGSSPNSKKRSATASTTSSTNNSNSNSNSNSKNSKTTTSTSNNPSSKKAKYSNSNTTKTNYSKHPASNASTPALHPRKNADIVEQGKRLWNCLRCKNNTPTQIRDYMNELYPLIQGKVMELTMQHDASRIVQAAIQFGNMEERRQIVQELCPTTSTSTSSTSTSSHEHKPTKLSSSVATTTNTNTTATTSTTSSSTTTTTNKHSFLDVCQSQYAHFVVLKLLKYCYKDAICMSLLINAFKGHMMKLITHTNGCRIVEVLFQSNVTSSSSGNSSKSHSSTTVVIPKDKIAILKQEIYGPHYAVFAQDTLQQLVTLVQQQQKQQQQQEISSKGNTKTTSKEITFVSPTLALNISLLPEKKEMTMDHIRNNIILKGIDKQLYGYYYFQEIMYEYVHVLMMDENFTAIRDLTSTTSITDQTIHLLSSKYGAKVVCQFIAYSTVKERKRIVKSCKGYTKSALFHKDAYLVLIRLIQCIDDTVVLYKNVLQELLSYTNASSLSLSNTKTSSSDTNASTTKNINAVLSISKSKEIVHSTNNDDSSPDQGKPLLLEIALTETASKLLLTILIPTRTSETTDAPSSAGAASPMSPSYTKIFNPYELDVLHPSNPYIMEKVSASNADTNMDSNNITTTTKNGITLQKVYTSKKDPELRRFEILQYFHVPLLQQLCAKEQHVFELLHSIPGSNVLYHLYVATIQALTTSGTDRAPTKPSNPNTHHQLSQLLNDMIRMICLVCRNNLTSNNNNKNVETLEDHSMEKENVFEHKVGHRVIKNLIMYDASIASTNDSTPTPHTEHTDTSTTTTAKIPSFSEMFVQEFASDFMSMTAYNRGAFILAALLQVSSVRTRVLDHLNVTTLLLQPSSSEPHEAKTNTPTGTAGLHALRQEINKTS